MAIDLPMVDSFCKHSCLSRRLRLHLDDQFITDEIIELI